MPIWWLHLHRKKNSVRKNENSRRRRRRRTKIKNFFLKNGVQERFNQAKRERRRKEEFKQKTQFPNLYDFKKIFINNIFFVEHFIYNGYFQYTQKEYKYEEKKFYKFVRWKNRLIKKKKEKQLNDHYVDKMDETENRRYSTSLQSKIKLGN